MYLELMFVIFLYRLYRPHLEPILHCYFLYKVVLHCRCFVYHRGPQQAAKVKIDI